MKPTWSGAGIHTPASLRRSNRRLDAQRLAAERQRELIERVLAAMKAGASLHLQYGPARSWWCLSDGPPVSTEVALVVVNHPFVVATGDGLFRDLPGQTWRYVESKGNHQ